jgi:dephospho-CoA kinase
MCCKLRLQTIEDTMKIIGLTGGIGSGKTTLAKLISNDLPVIHGDEFNHEVMRMPHIQAKVLKHFGTLDRLELRKLIFNDPLAKARMEGIFYSEVSELFHKRLGELQDAGNKWVMYDSALIFQFGLDKICFTVIGVISPIVTRLDRIIARDNMDEELAMKIINSQMSNTELINKCEFAIYNSKTPEYMYEQAKAILEITRS